MPVPAGSSPTPAPAAGPLYYEPTLSRVRVDVPGLPADVNDQFDRTVSADWGTATSGQVWTCSGAPAAQFAANGVAGTHTVNALYPTVFRSVLDLPVRDFRLRLPAMLYSIAPTGAHVRTEVLVRQVDTSNYVRVSALINPGNLVDLRIESVTGGVVTELAAVPTGITHSPGVSLGLIAEGFGSQITASVWKDGTTEPTDWQATAADPIPRVGDVGILTMAAPGNSNGTFTVLYDGLTVEPFAQVERSTDGVRWSTVRGGEQVALTDGVLRLDDYEFTPGVTNWYRAVDFTGSINPDIGGAWLKSVARPFLNRQVVLRDYSEITRRARGGVFDVIDRTMPVAVTSVRGSRQWTLDVNTYTEQERSDVDMLLAAGDILLVQVPPNAGRLSAAPSGYVTVGDTREVTPPTAELDWRVFNLPMTEVAAPGPDVVGATSTWQSVLNAYATWADVMAAHPTWADLQELIGDPTEVIVD